MIFIKINSPEPKWVKMYADEYYNVTTVSAMWQLTSSIIYDFSKREVLRGDADPDALYIHLWTIQDDVKFL